MLTHHAGWSLKSSLLIGRSARETQRRMEPGRTFDFIAASRSCRQGCNSSRAGSASHSMTQCKHVSSIPMSDRRQCAADPFCWLCSTVSPWPTSSSIAAITRFAPADSARRPQHIEQDDRTSYSSVTMEASQGEPTGSDGSIWQVDSVSTHRTTRESRIAALERAFIALWRSQRATSG